VAALVGGPEDGFFVADVFVKGNIAHVYLTADHPPSAIGVVPYNMGAKRTDKYNDLAYYKGNDVKVVVKWSPVAPTTFLE
jgi:hypothetical protein